MKKYYVAMSTTGFNETLQLRDTRREVRDDLQEKGFMPTWNDSIGQVYSKRKEEFYQEMRIVEIIMPPEKYVKPAPPAIAETEIGALTRQIKRLGERLDRIHNRL